MPGCGWRGRCLSDCLSRRELCWGWRRARVSDRLLMEGEMRARRSVSARDVLAAATSGGARAVMLEYTTGSLPRGKEASIMMFRATELKLFRMTAPVGAVVQCAQAAT